MRNIYILCYNTDSGKGGVFNGSIKGSTECNKQMERKARELRELQSLIEEAAAEAEALKDAIKAAMGDAEEVHAGEYKITWKAVTTARIDTAALKKALPDLAQQFTKATTTRRFCVA